MHKGYADMVIEIPEKEKYKIKCCDTYEIDTKGSVYYDGPSLVSNREAGGRLRFDS